MCPTIHGFPDGPGRQTAGDLRESLSIFLDLQSLHGYFEEVERSGTHSLSPSLSLSLSLSLSHTQGTYIRLIFLSRQWDGCPLGLGLVV